MDIFLAGALVFGLLMAMFIGDAIRKYQKKKKTMENEEADKIHYEYPLIAAFILAWPFLFCLAIMGGAV